MNPADTPENPPAAYQPRPRTGRRGQWVRALGPGLITGAADDDPSGVVTYSQAGAAFGYALGWSVVLTLPFMVAVQEISARIGRVTGHGLGTALKRHASRPMVMTLVGLLVVANVINLGADLGAMAAVTGLLFGGSQHVYAVLFALFCVVAEIWLAYKRYVQVLKWLTVSLLAYVALLFVVAVPWRQAIAGVLLPHVAFSRDMLTTVLAVLGTTISPYLFFWQASEEAEDEQNSPDPRPLAQHPDDAAGELRRIGYDTWVGMVYSNLVALAIVIGCAATLHSHGETDIGTAADAAAALKPVAGPFAQTVFALGIVGTGLLGVPTLAGSAAYGVSEAMEWTVGLSKQAIEARAFYGTLAAATVIGVSVALSPIDPIKALFWAAVINGVVAAPIIAAMVVLGSSPKVMGALVIPRWLRLLGWVTAGLMAAATAGMVLV